MLCYYAVYIFHEGALSVFRLVSVAYIAVGRGLQEICAENCTESCTESCGGLFLVFSDCVGAGWGQYSAVRFVPCCVCFLRWVWGVRACVRVWGVRARARVLFLFVCPVLPCAVRVEFFLSAWCAMYARQTLSRRWCTLFLYF